MFYVTIFIVNLCEQCPRKCGINRKKQSGFCGAKTLKIAKVMKHYWEEPAISENGGSGAIFFSHCSMKCIFCQNYQISILGQGTQVTVEKLAQIFSQLEESGVNNINLVSPTHYTDEIIQALQIYKPKIPIVWNTSGYETVENIKRIKNYVDIYLCDFKYFDKKIANEYSKAPNYKDICLKALKQMRKNQKKDIFDSTLLKKGLIVRHLVLPTHYKDSIKILNCIKEHLGKRTIISIMSQYTPCFLAKNHNILKNKIKPIEYKAVLREVEKLGFVNGYYQDYSSAICDYIPDFSLQDENFKLH